MGTVRHWQPFWSRKSFCFIGHCCYFNPQWTPEQAIIVESSVRTVLVSWEKCAVTKCLRIYRRLWRGLGGAGGTFWLLNESLTFKGPEAWQATAVNQIGVNKIPPNFDTLFATSLEVIRLFKELTAWRFWKLFGVKGLIIVNLFHRNWSGRQLASWDLWTSLAVL